MASRAVRAYAGRAVTSLFLSVDGPDNAPDIDDYTLETYAIGKASES